MQYDIEFEVKQDDGYKNIPMVGKVEQNEAYGDQIGICSKDNILWVSEDVDIENNEGARDFVKEHFKNRRAVLGFLLRILN